MIVQETTSYISSPHVCSGECEEYITLSIEIDELKKEEEKILMQAGLEFIEMPEGSQHRLKWEPCFHKGLACEVKRSELLENQRNKKFERGD